jgi:hypothetical protein
MGQFGHLSLALHALFHLGCAIASAFCEIFFSTNRYNVSHPFRVEQQALLKHNWSVYRDTMKGTKWVNDEIDEETEVDYEQEDAHINIKK